MESPDGSLLGDETSSDSFFEIEKDSFQKDLDNDEQDHNKTNDESVQINGQRRLEAFSSATSEVDTSFEKRMKMYDLASPFKNTESSSFAGQSVDDT